MGKGCILWVLTITTGVAVMIQPGCKKENNAEPWPPLNTQPAFQLQSINMTAWGRDWWDDEKLVDEALRFILEEGSNLLTLDWAVNFENDGHIVPLDNDTASLHPLLEKISSIIAKAHQRGLKVMLKPHVTLRYSAANRNIWNTDTSLFLASNFFPDYQNYWDMLASFATQKGVEYLCIGTELNHIDWMYRQQWLSLIAAIRQRFNGQLTYDALFDRWLYNKNLIDVVFWDQLDFIGVSLYVPLTTDDNAPVDTLRRGFFQDLGEWFIPGGWFKIDNVISFLEGFAAQHQKPLMAVEGGYPSKHEGLYYVSPPDPNSYVHEDLQARGLDAYLGVLKENQGQWFKGVSLWCITPYMLPPEALQSIWHTQDFNFYQKPAAPLVKHHFYRTNP
ncbi:MAG: hypothetical protein PWR20_2248 [Bacteroidales bacterium]|nr:hypothetical protein [Bacteroidales bacterium]MDN5329120.1 hypothetical protein [Bacteroidales bacterium]